METIKCNEELLNKRRALLCRLIFACIFLFLIYDFISVTSIQHLHSPVLVFPYVDVTYILFNLTHAGDFLSGNYFVSCFYDLLLFLFCVLTLIYPNKKIFILLFLVLYFFYFMMYNDYGMHHIHSKIGILLIPIPFLFSNKNFIYVWEGLRYYTLFIYTDAFIWKLFRQTWLYSKQGVLIIKENITPLLYQHPNYSLRGFYNYLFLHPNYADILFKTGFVLEGLFVVGFFTKKFDKCLFIISVLLAFGFLFLVDAFSFELLILDFTLLFNFRNKSNFFKSEAAI